MSTQNTEGGSTVIATPSGIATYQLVALKSALRLEVAGMAVRQLRSQGGALRVTERITGVRYTTKAKALAGVTQLIDDIKSGAVAAPAQAR